MSTEKILRIAAYQRAAPVSEYNVACSKVDMHVYRLVLFPLHCKADVSSERTTLERTGRCLFLQRYEGRLRYEQGQKGGFKCGSCNSPTPLTTEYRNRKVLRVSSKIMICL